MIFCSVCEVHYQLLLHILSLSRRYCKKKKKEDEVQVGPLSSCRDKPTCPLPGSVSSYCHIAKKMGNRKALYLTGINSYLSVWKNPIDRANLRPSHSHTHTVGCWNNVAGPLMTMTFFRRLPIENGACTARNPLLTVCLTRSGEKNSSLSCSNHSQ